MWTCPQHRMPDDFRVGIHDASNEFRLQLEGRFGAVESREVESCWRTAASTIGGRRFIIDVSRVGSLDSTAAKLLSRMRDSGAQFQGDDSRFPQAIGRPREFPPGRPANEDNPFCLLQFPELLACLLLRFRAWARWPAVTRRSLGFQRFGRPVTLTEFLASSTMRKGPEHRGSTERS